MPDIAAHHYSFFPVRLLSRYNYPTGDNIRNVNVPVLIIHSPDDEIIPYSHGQSLFENALEPKYFLEIKGGHNDGAMITGNHYLEGINRFLSRL